MMSKGEEDQRKCSVGSQIKDGWLVGHRHVLRHSKAEENHVNIKENLKKGQRYGKLTAVASQSSFGGLRICNVWWVWLLYFGFLHPFIHP